MHMKDTTRTMVKTRAARMSAKYSGRVAGFIERPTVFLRAEFRGLRPHAAVEVGRVAAGAGVGQAVLHAGGPPVRAHEVRLLVLAVRVLLAPGLRQNVVQPAFLVREDQDDDQDNNDR